MIIQIGTEADESRILWKHKESDEWERADIDDLICAYENRPRGKWENSEDCISRQQAIEEMQKYLMVDEVTENDEFSDGENSGVHMAIGVVCNLPPVTPKERTGEYITEKNSYEIICSECRCEAFSEYGIWFLSDYCPYCGAKMKGGAK